MSTAPARAALRAQLSSGELIIAPGVFDGISAHLAARLGFTAAYLTGAGTAASGFGLPDIGLVTLTEMAERARMVTRVLGGVPLIADADTGYGATLNVARTVQEYEAAGVAAIQLEDQAFPKKCGHLPDKELISAGEFTRKLRAALDARSDPDLVVIARTDARAPLGIGEAIGRANAYAEAGADVIFVEAPQSTAEIEQIAREVRAPLLINMVGGGLTPIEPPQRLAELGYAIAIYPALALAGAAQGMLTALADLAGTGTGGLATSSPADIFRIVGLTEWAQADAKYQG